jgi:predicted signal transduction protein with EAL and GGDEF domain/ABC-type amino acid transport substrate-binding protein
MWARFKRVIQKSSAQRPKTRDFLRRRQLCALLIFCHSFLPGALALADPPDKITVAGDANYPPFEWQQHGEPTGFNVDLIKAMAEVTNTRLEYQLGNWPDAVSALERGEVDVVPMFASEPRDARFLFSSPFYFVSHSIYAHRNAPPVYTLEALRGKRVAVEARSYAHQRLTARDLEVEPLLTPNTLQALQAVVRGEANYAVLARPTADSLIRRMDLPVVELGPPLWPSAYVWAVRGDRPELLQWLQGVLDVAIGTGQYQAVYARWEDELEGRVRPPEAWLKLLAFTGIVLLLAALVVAWSWILRSQVKARTRALSSALTRAHQAESRALHLYNYDTNTGLAKADHFIALVNDKLAGDDAPMEMLLIKMVQLNELVKLLGKGYADSAIREFAEHIRNRSRDPCAYFGRGTFAVFSDRENVRSLFESLLAKWGIETRGIYSHIVAGSAFFPEHGRDGEQLLLRAETALAVSRSSRRRWMTYDPSMEPDASDLEIVAAFRSTNPQGLYAVFQPQLDLRQGCVAGAEALARWHHPLLGQIEPTRFIPLIEKAGLVSVVTSHMIGEGVRVSTQLRRKNLPSTVSVNITISDLMETDLPGTIRQALQTHGGVPGDLRLELTETSVAKEFQTIKEVLEQLHQLGVCLAVDDFGTGYSSLSYLSVFPFDEVKIDSSFIRDMASNPKNRSIVRSTVALAAELGLQTVAEGAEDSAALNALTEVGCDRVQGFAFSKPLEEKDFFAFVRAHRPVEGSRTGSKRTLY